MLASSGRLRTAALAAVVALLLAVAPGFPGAGTPGRAAHRGDVRVLAGEPTTLDPAASGDAATAAVTAQLYESVSALDPGLVARPALAERWDVLDDGRRVVFHLREGIRFSDGSPIEAEDVVRSWLRIIDPERPSPLASLMLDVAGAREYLAGRATAADVGLTANGRTVEVRLARPASDFVAIVAGPTFGVVPPAIDDGSTTTPEGFVGSGAYRLTRTSSTELVLEANEHYWAGRPAIGTVHLVTDLGGRSSVAAFEDGDLDYAGISSFDAAWIRYDERLGPSLRAEPSLSVEYYGFDASRPPFDDPRVRRAFAAAVDWRRLVMLARPDDAVPATSIVPPGIPGRSDRDFLPAHDPDGANALLAEAGYPGGEGFPDVALVTGGSPYDEALLAQLRDNLGVGLRYESMDFDEYFARLATEPPAMWSLAWVADYPGRNDFLGVLLESGASNNYGRWSSEEFDAAIREAGELTDAAAAAAAYDRAEEVVAREVPIIPVSYGDGWALSREGLLGAHQNGLSILRLAGLAWSD